MESSRSMAITVFWLWVEENGRADVLQHIDSIGDDHLLRIARAGKSFIETLYDPSLPYSDFGQYALQGIAFYLDKIHCRALRDVREKDCKMKIMNPYGEGSSAGRSMGSGIPKRMLGQAINHGCAISSDHTLGRVDGFPIAHFKIPPEERTLFVTFSNGYPLAKEELFDFFMSNFGDVEKISIEEPLEPRPPLFAQVTFSSLEILLRVLGGKKKGKFMIAGKHLWARKFVPIRKMWLELLGAFSSDTMDQLKSFVIFSASYHVMYGLVSWCLCIRLSITVFHAIVCNH